MQSREAWSIGWVAGAVLLSAAAAAQPPLAALGPAIVLAALAWRWPDTVLGVVAFVVLALRPSLDIFSERRAGLGPLAWQPAALCGAVVLFAGAVLAVRRRRDGKRIWPDAEVLAAHRWLALALAILVFSGARLYGSMGLAEGVRELGRVASIVAAFLSVWWWLEGRPDRARRGWLFLVLGLIPPLAAAGWQLITGRGFWEPGSGLRIQGTFSHPNSFAQYLAPFVVFAIVGIPGARFPGKVWRIAAALGLSLLIVLTYSRTTILVLATSLVALVLMQLWWRGRRSAGPVLAVLLVAAVGWLAIGGQIRQRFADLSFSGAVENARVGRSENSFGWRLLNWRGLVLRGMDHPFTGHGAGMTTHLNPLVNENNGIPFNAHNDFVRFFFEGGVFGLACYILYGLLLCRWAVRWGRMLGGESAAIAATLVAMIFLTAGMTELSLQTANLYTLYGMLALADAPWRRATTAAPRVPAPATNQ
ncbi:MAG TPA: O-antigen ligase family protein [Gemmatimonadales bacterium]|nr:O-antigen ligase family protein [Gemmatimonadales bacterium]